MRVAFRADASPAIGSGHVVRCLCLANHLKAAGAETVFVSSSLPPFMRQQLEAGGHGLIALSATASRNELTDAQETLRCLGEVDRVVVDHYGLGAAWERVVQAKAPVLAIDDLVRMHESDLVLDQNYHLHAERRYAGRLASSATALLGPRYALLRPEFLEARSRASIRDHGVRAILVSLGGMDGDNVTSLALEALDSAGIPEVRVDVVVGAMHPAMDHIRHWCASRPRSGLHVQVSDMAELMLAADLAIGAGGQTTWERCAVALPAITICLAENQSEIIRQGALAGFLHGIEQVPSAEELADDIRFFVRRPVFLEAMSRRAHEVVDARGARRVAATLHPPTVNVREASMEDARFIHALRTDETVREASRSPALSCYEERCSSYEEHCVWMQRVIADPRRMLLVGEHGGRAVGSVWFDIREARAEVSVFLDPARRGSSLGFALLRAGERHLKRQRPEVSLIEAWINEGDDPSECMFTRGGYGLRVRLFEKRI